MLSSIRSQPATVPLEKFWIRLGYGIPSFSQVARDYGIEDELPCLVYFENEIPSIYHGDLSNEEQVLDWLIEQINSDSIEEVTDKILESLVEKNQHVAVIFCGYTLLPATCIIHSMIRPSWAIPSLSSNNPYFWF